MSINDRPILPPIESAETQLEAENDPLQELRDEMNDIFVDFEAATPLPDAAFDAKLAEESALTQENQPVYVDPAYYEMQQTFLQILKQVLRPVTRYMKAINAGNEARELFEIINFTVTPLIEKIESVELFSHTNKLLNFKMVLSRILATHFGTVHPQSRAELTQHFDEIRAAFELHLRASQVAVENILTYYRRLSFDDMITVADIRRFFAIGIPSVSWVRKTKGSEIASLSGIELEKVVRLKKLANEIRPQPVQASYEPPQVTGTVSDEPETNSGLRSSVVAEI